VVLLLVGTAGAALAAGKPTVGVDLTTLEIKTYEELDGLSLEKRMVLRLVQEGFAAVTPAQGPDVLVTIRRTPEGLRIEARGPLGARERTIPLRGDPLEELHLEIVHRVLGLVRLSLAPMTPPTSPSSTSVVAGAPTERLPRDRVPREKRRRWRMEPSAGVDALWRSSGPDLLVRLGFRLGQSPGLGGHLSLGLSPSSGEGIDVQEWQVQAGVGYRLALSARFDLEGGVLLGVVVHRYDVNLPDARDAGSAVTDFLGALPVVLTYCPFSHVGIALRVAPGVAGASQRHLLNSRVLWERGSLRLETGLALVGRW